MKKFNCDCNVSNSYFNNSDSVLVEDSIRFKIEYNPKRKKKGVIRYSCLNINFCPSCGRALTTIEEED